MKPNPFSEKNRLLDGKVKMFHPFIFPPKKMGTGQQYFWKTGRPEKVLTFRGIGIKAVRESPPNATGKNSEKKHIRLS